MMLQKYCFFLIFPIPEIRLLLPIFRQFDAKIRFFREICKRRTDFDEIVKHKALDDAGCEAHRRNDCTTRAGAFY